MKKSKNFEDVYMLLFYYRKAVRDGTLRPDSVAKYKLLAHKICNGTYGSNARILKNVGMDYEDLLQVINIYILYYCSIYDLEVNAEYMRRFVEQRKRVGREIITEKDIEIKNICSLTNFVYQRLYAFFGIIKQKQRSCVGLTEVTVFVKTDINGDRKRVKINKKQIKAQGLPENVEKFELRTDACDEDEYKEKFIDGSGFYSDPESILLMKEGN